MNYQNTPVEGAFIVSQEPRGDERGFFARAFCADEFAVHGLENTISQINNSASTHAGTLRGLHYQVAPFGEVKLVRCLRGSIYDVVVDLRRESATFGKWAGATLTADNRLMMYAPRGCAHGYMALEDGAEVLYPSSAPYNGQAERILRWNDPRFGVIWPRQPVALSDKDRDAPDYNPDIHSSGY